MAIPGSFLTALLLLYLLEVSLNIVVLFSLILAVGMLVDGAIVVTEFADRKLSEGVFRRQAYLQASQRMPTPIPAPTPTTLAVGKLGYDDSTINEHSDCKNKAEQHYDVK
jgi:multidrug efflux pump